TGSGRGHDNTFPQENKKIWHGSPDPQKFRSSGSLSSLNMESGGEGAGMGGWGRLGNSLLDGGTLSDSDTDCGELPELEDAVWTLRDRERFKAQEMEKHQVQLTMYRRLALIRWVRTLQGRVQEQQNRLQSSFDVILDHRKELLRMGAGTTATATHTKKSVD
uniref:Uncharacterized protein n=1 Tax=Oncorhynchus mykiss TaxID=8022 RepID=A0A8K9UW83_ONCMY